jgi:hypothetical protein
VSGRVVNLFCNAVDNEKKFILFGKEFGTESIKETKRYCKSVRFLK